MARVLVVAVAILTAVLALGLPSLIARPFAGAVQSALGGARGASPVTAFSPPAGVASFRDARGNLWTWEPTGPQRPHWQITGPRCVAEVSPEGTLLSGASLGAIAFPTVKVTHQGKLVVVETIDGNAYVLPDNPDKGSDQQYVQDVADQILSTRDSVNTVSFVQRSPLPTAAQPRDLRLAEAGLRASLRRSEEPERRR